MQTTLKESLHELAGALALCECGRPAGAAPVRCTDCGAPLCAVCAAEPPGQPEPLDLCFACAAKEIRDCPADEAELAWALMEIRAGAERAAAVEAA